MKTIILPGQSVKNKEWAQEVKSKLESNQLVCETIEWTHWNHKIEGEFDTAGDLQRVKELIGEQKVNILAKSIGTFITAYLLDQIPSQLNKLVLCGIPLNFLKNHFLDEDYFKVIKKANGKNITVLQNTADPLGSFEEIEKVFKKTNPEIKVLERKRDDHSYPHYQDFVDLLK
jgi:hypothetical protein